MRVLAFTPDSLDNASILVCGGGGVALDVTRKLKEAGSWVWQLQRTDVRRCGKGRCCAGHRRAAGRRALPATGCSLPVALTAGGTVGFTGLAISPI